MINSFKKYQRQGLQWCCRFSNELHISQSLNTGFLLILAKKSGEATYGETPQNDPTTLLTEVCSVGSEINSTKQTYHNVLTQYAIYMKRGAKWRKTKFVQGNSFFSAFRWH